MCNQSMMSRHLKKYLIHFANEHLEFRLPEIRSIISLLGVKASIKETSISKWNPFLEIGLYEEKDAIKIMNRSVLSKRMYELMAEGTTVEDIKHQIDNLPQEATEEFTKQDKSFRIMVEAVNKKIPGQDKIRRIELLTQTSPIFKNKINLKTPDVSFHLLECYENESKPSDSPFKVFFGRWVADGQRNKIVEYSLQKRNFIANTSMDACLSMVMTNLAQVQPCDLVLDPFVGSGSLLVASAHFGGYVVGTDLDYLLLHARAKPSRAKQKTRGKEESVYQNLVQYGLESRYLDVMVADASRHRLWRQGCRFNAIVTDPPYGIRESASRVATKDSHADVQLTEGTPRYPQKAQYNIGDIFKDLLDFSAQYLEVGGRLVYWLPTYRPDYSPASVPQHPCLSLESNCEQPLSTTISRRLITMVKVRDVSEVKVGGEEGSEVRATIGVNHYDTFRQKYFKSTAEKLKEEEEVRKEEGAKVGEKEVQKEEEEDELCNNILQQRDNV